MSQTRVQYTRNRVVYTLVVPPTKTGSLGSAVRSVTIFEVCTKQCCVCKAIHRGLQTDVFQTDELQT